MTTIETLRRQADACTACPLYRHATQTVFGEGAPRAAIVLVGEQPGDEEDRAGRPFVGPTGRLLDRALTRAGLDRSALYITNAVKHFKWTKDRAGGKRRIHERPSPDEIEACRAEAAHHHQRGPGRDAHLAGGLPDARDHPSLRHPSHLGARGP